MVLMGVLRLLVGRMHWLACLFFVYSFDNYM